MDSQSCWVESNQGVGTGRAGQDRGEAILVMEGDEGTKSLGLDERQRSEDVLER